MHSPSLVLRTFDTSLAGDGEAHKGEAVENEARQYVNDIANAVKEAAAGALAQARTVHARWVEARPLISWITYSGRQGENHRQQADARAREG